MLATTNVVLPGYNRVGTLQNMLADRVKSLRQKAGLSQAALAKKAKVSQQLITRIGTGDVLESRKLPQIAHALGKSAEDLLDASPPLGVREPTMAYHGIYLTRAGAMLGAEWEKLDVADRIEIENEIMTRVARSMRSRRSKHPAADEKPEKQ